MQIAHQGIVRRIDFTHQAPWVTIFPYFNSGTIEDMLLYLPYKEGTFGSLGN